METTERKKHWETIYQTKNLAELSWYQPTPQTSLDFIKEAKLSKDAAIIDVGGGDSLLVDHMLQLGYTNISVLDISEVALNKARKRLGEDAGRVKWIMSDITEFRPSETYDLWHDRAAFHFLTTDEKVSEYFSIAETYVKAGGQLIIGTFSDNGPKKCSGLEIKQYNKETMTQTFTKGFEPIKCITEDHSTPFNTQQNFLFCSFRKRRRFS